MPALSLSKLVDLALGTPEVGAVNFNILHSLLHAMIQHLKITDVTADINENDRDFLSGPEKLQLLSSLSADSGKDSQDTQDDNTDLRKHRPPYHQLENKVARLAEQLEQLNALPSTSELFQKIKATGDRPTPMQDLWQSMQISKRVGANEDGVGKLMTMVEDLMREMALLKDGYGRMDDLEEQMRKLRDENNNLKNKIDNLGMDDLLNRLNDLESYIKDLNEKFAQLPDLSHVPGPEEFAAFVTWPGLEDALNGVRSDFAELAARRATPPQSAHRPYQPQPVAHTQPEHAVPAQPAATAPAQPAAQPQSRPQTPHQQPPPPAQLPDTPAAPSPTFPSQTDVRSRPSSSRPSTRLSSASSGPSNQLLEILERLGKLVGSHEALEKRVEILEGDMRNKVDKDFLDRALKGLNMHLLGDLEEQLEQMKDDISNLQKQMQANREQGYSAADLEALVRAQHAIQKLRDDVDNLQISTQEIISDNETKGKQIESLFVYCDKLQDVKADKEYVAMEVDVKADKRHLEGKVNHSLFDSATAEINRLIKEIQDKLNGNEFDWKDAIAKLSEELESKLDRMELNSLKEWLESRLKALNQKIKQTQRFDDDDAAGIRKQLLQRFHCISCDRPVDIMAAGPVPSIPASNGLPATRSPRPYTTYELDQIRQHAKRISVADRPTSAGLAGQEAEFYNPDRPCGGSHTLTYPHKRITKMAHMGNMYQSEPPVTPAPAPVAFKHDSELDILGVDGHIYKGRVDKADPSRRLVPNYTNMGVDRSPPMSPHVPIRPSTSNGSTKPTPTPVPPTGRPRPTSAVQRPTSSSSVARMTSSGRLTMRPQSARASSQGGSNSSSPPPEEPRQFVPAAEEQMSPEQGRVEEPEDAPEPVEIPGDTPREEVGQSATQED